MTSFCAGAVPAQLVHNSSKKLMPGKKRQVVKWLSLMSQAVHLQRDTTEEYSTDHKKFSAFGIQLLFVPINQTEAVNPYSGPNHRETTRNAL